MYQQNSRVHPLTRSRVCDLSTPPKPSINTEEQHPHPHDETPVDAGEGNGQESKVEEKEKKKKKWWRVTSFFRALRKPLKSSSSSAQGEVEQEQQSEKVKPQNKCRARCSDDYTFSHSQLGDQLCEGAFGTEPDPEVSVKHLNKTDEDVEGLYILGYPHRLPEEIALNILANRGLDIHVCDLSTPPKPSTNTEEQHPHPHDETPVDAGEGNGQESKVEEKEKKKKKWWRVTSFFRALKKHLKGGSNSVQGEVEQLQEKEKQQEQQSEKVKPQKEWKARCSDDYIFSHYQLGDLLGKGGFGTVYEARRLEDDLKVAVKYVNKTNKYKEGLCVAGCRQSLPVEIALTILANRGPIVPEIIQLLDWKDYSDHYVMILEYPSPCKTLEDFVRHQGGSLKESLAQQVMRQVTQAANVCCKRNVFHRDIKLSNLLINNETLEIKLIDFGCGDILRKTVYMSYHGTSIYSPPEFHLKGKYHGMPATVWSLGVLLFRMVAGHYPDFLDLHLLKLHLWSKPGLSKVCCRLLRVLLQEKPKKRIHLEEILYHKWFMTTPEVSVSSALQS